MIWLEMKIRKAYQVYNKFKIMLNKIDFSLLFKLEFKEKKNGFRNRFVHMIDDNKKRPSNEFQRKQKSKLRQDKEENSEDNLVFIPKETVEKQLAESKENSTTATTEASTAESTETNEPTPELENAENVSELKESNENEAIELAAKKEVI